MFGAKTAELTIKDKMNCASGFSSDFERVFAYHLTGKILSFEFYPKAVYFECKFWILRSAITHVQNWAIEHQRAGSSENDDVIYSPA